MFAFSETMSALPPIATLIASFGMSAKGQRRTWRAAASYLPASKRLIPAPVRARALTPLEFGTNSRMYPAAIRQSRCLSGMVRSDAHFFQGLKFLVGKWDERAFGYAGKSSSYSCHAIYAFVRNNCRDLKAIVISVSNWHMTSWVSCFLETRNW